MKRVRQESRGASRSRDAPGGDARAGDEAASAPGGADPSLAPDVAPRKTSATERENAGGRPVDGPAETGARASPTISSGSEDDLRTIDRLLQQTLGSGRKCSQGLEMAADAILAGERHSEEEQGGVTETRRRCFE